MLNISDYVDHGDVGLEDDDSNNEDDDVEDGHSCALFTLDTLASTPNGVTSPMMITFFDSMSMLNDVTPTYIIYWIRLAISYSIILNINNIWRNYMTKQITDALIQRVVDIMINYTTENVKP